jgi:hypothetical protein
LKDGKLKILNAQQKDTSELVESRKTGTLQNVHKCKYKYTPCMANVVDGDEGDNDSGYKYNDHTNDDDDDRVFIL